MNCGCDEVPYNATLHPIVFTSKSPLSANLPYSNIEHEALRILHGLEKDHHYCFARKVYIITDNKPLGAILSKGVAMLSYLLTHIMLHIHQYKAHIVYKPSPGLYITDWLSRKNHTEDKDQDITGMNINVNDISTTVNMTECTSIQEIQVAMCEDAHLQKLKSYIILSWPHKKKMNGNTDQPLLAD